jgi:glycosyltransferase involved in cell wall biosynthesis
MTHASGRRVRVGFLYTHPIQYAAPLMRLINRSADIEAVPIYLTDFSLRGAVDKQFGVKVVWDIDLLEGTDPIFVDGYKTREVSTGLTAMPAPQVWKIVREARLDALVVQGHVQLAVHIAVLAAKSIGIPVFYRSETHLLLPRGKAKRIARRLLMGGYYKLLDGFLAIGTRNHLFYRAMGVPDSKVFDVPYAVDNERMIANSSLSSSQRSAKRRELGARDGIPLLVYASKLTRRKHPDDLLKAARSLRREGLDFDLLFVGTGEMEGELRNAAAANFPGPPPLFTGFLNQTELPAVLGASDIFILPAENEPWGLIINEAMCAGLAIVTSREVGAVPDLVHEGVNGRLFDAGNIAQLTTVLRDLVQHPGRTSEMGAESRRIVAGWGYGEDLEGLRAALVATKRLSR